VAAIAGAQTLGYDLANPTLSTAGVPVQAPPCLYFDGHVWNTTSVAVDNTSEATICMVPTSGTTPSAVLKFGFSLNGGGATFPLQVSSSGAFIMTGGNGQSLLLSSGMLIQWTTRGIMGSSADGKFELQNNGQTSTTQLNIGTAAPTVTTCGTGAVTAHSTNFSGEITPTGATACTVTFGAPNFTNQPFCVITVEGATITDYVSAISVSAFTVSGLASSEKFMYTCSGGV
jgi:hypothetical protein